MVKGRVDKKASTATGYAWLVWEKSRLGSGSELMWIPPCRKMLEREGDYQQAPRMPVSATVLPLRKARESDLFARDLNGGCPRPDEARNRRDD